MNSSLAGHGLVDELDEAVARTGAYMATLPSPAPDCAQHLVLRADALRSRVIIEVTRLKESIGFSRSSLRRARRVVRQYGPPRSGRYSTSA